MKNHILYRHEIVTPDEARLRVGDPKLGPMNAVHAAVLEMCGQGGMELSPRNEALPHPEDALQEGRILVISPENGVYGAAEIVREMANRMQRSNRTLKDGASTHPMGRYHSSAILTAMPSVGQEVSRQFAELYRPVCSAVRELLIPRGLTIHSYAGRETGLIIVRPLYACDLSYLSPNELPVYREFYGDGDCSKGGFALD